MARFLQVFSGYTVPEVLDMPSITFLALLNEGHKLDIYEKKMLITIASYPHMDKENQDEITASLLLPDDVLSDMIDSETPDDINTLKDFLDAN